LKIKKALAKVRITPSIDGYDLYELLSALQKDIRRGNEEQALAKCARALKYGASCL